MYFHRSGKVVFLGMNGIRVFDLNTAKLTQVSTQGYGYLSEYAVKDEIPIKVLQIFAVFAFMVLKFYFKF